MAHPPEYRYTLQVAAYTTRAAAERLVKRLAARGLDARVVGTKRPFRVRIGRYATHADAAAALRKLEARKIHAVIADLTDGES